MKIITKAVYDIETGELMEEQSYEYSGPVALAKSKEQKEQQNINLESARRQQEAQQRAMAQAQQAYQQQQSIYGQLSPFATQALNIGQGALSGNIPPEWVNMFKSIGRNALSSSFSGGRNNLIEALGQSGQYGSGVQGGPLASFEQDQARAFGESDTNASLQALMQALGLGFQGANVLQGQQAMFNPLGYTGAGISAGQAGTRNPQEYARAGGGVLGSILGTATQAGMGALTGGASLAGSSFGDLWSPDNTGGSLPFRRY